MGGSEELFFLLAPEKSLNIMLVILNTLEE